MLSQVKAYRSKNGVKLSTALYKANAGEYKDNKSYTADKIALYKLLGLDYSKTVHGPISIVDIDTLSDDVVNKALESV